MSLYWVSLIEVEPQDEGAETYDPALLEGECTHVAGNIWLYEGDVEMLEDQGIDFQVLDEGAVPDLGGLTTEQLKALCNESFALTDPWGIE